MKRSSLLLKPSYSRVLAVLGAAALFSGTHNAAHATQTVRELFDKIGNSDYITIDSLAGGATSFGLQGTWATSPWGGIVDTGTGLVTNTVPSTGIVYKDTWSLDWPLQGLNNGLVLTHGGGQNGLLNFNSGGNLGTIVDTNTLVPFGNFTSQSYATRPLTPGARIDFKANGTYYFSVRLVKSYSWWVGDNSAGVGFSTGGGTNDHFVGVGVTRKSTFTAEDGVTEITNTTYISTGTLGQDGLPAHSDDSGGPYYPRANGSPGLWEFGPGGVDWAQGGLLVGELTTTTSGASTLNVKAYLPNCPVYTNGVLYTGTNNYGVPITLEPDINNITWDATYNFTETNVMTHLLVFMHGTGALEYDALRVGTTYGDVVGLELIGAPKGTPANTVYEDVTLTISQLAGVNSGQIPMSFQWRSNGVPIVDATNATLVLTTPKTNLTANYSVVVSNFYGTLTSPETLITVLPGIAPIVVQQPAPTTLTRYAGSPTAPFSVVVDGTPPFTFQWKHAGTNIGSPTITSDVTNTLTIGPISVAEAGGYSVTVTNAYGLTNSALATLNVTTPSAGSYAAALLSLPINPTNLFGYWRMDDNATTNDPVIREYWNGNNGLVSIQDLNNGRITPGAEGAPYQAFPAPHLATAVGTTTAASPPSPWNYPYRVDLKNLPSAQTNMTFTMWVKGGVRLVARNGYGQAYGLENQGGNALRFYWGAYNSTNGIRTAQWDTGLTAPENEWTFVALVVEGTNATVYVGSKISFASASTVDAGGIPDPENGGGYMTIVNSTTLGESNLRLGVGRNPIPWADDGNGAPWTSTGGTWSDIAVFYQVLTPAQIKGLFLAGAGLWIESTPDGAGNWTLNWLPGYTLQQADNVQGPYTDVVGATPPYWTPIATTGSKFYRVK